MSENRRVLNVGGHDKAIRIPPHYADWDHLLLDIDARPGVDIVADARDLSNLEPAQFDAIYCSHTLEHFYFHDVSRVVQGFHHVLKPSGFIEVRVPDLLEVMRAVTMKRMDLESVLYESPVGPIRVLDVVYGYRKEIQESGNDFFTHKTGFSESSLRKVLKENGFPIGFLFRAPFEVYLFAFKQEPDDFTRELLNLPPD